MSAEIVLHADPIDALVVPRSVVTLSSRGELGVRIVDDKDTVVFAPITIIDDTSDGLVLSGVPEGAHVIISGQDSGFGWRDSCSLSMLTRWGRPQCQPLPRLTGTESR